MSRTKPFVRPLDSEGHWLADDRRHFENTHLLLAELEQVNAEVIKQWPKSLSESVKKNETTKAHWKLTRKRDLLSDSVKVFSAISVEAFLNFYGVYRLGEAQFHPELEKLFFKAQLIRLLKVCDEIDLTESHEIIKVAKKITTRRNLIVHPKTHEISGYLSAKDRGGDKVPDVAREAVSDMALFFQHFVELVPGAALQIPPPFDVEN